MKIHLLKFNKMTCFLINLIKKKIYCMIKKIQRQNKIPLKKI